MNSSYNYLANLNENQRKAVVSDKIYLRVVAGAGSGKTKVLTTRINYLIDHFLVKPQEILAITFTNKAAESMKDRILSSLQVGHKAPHVSTIHAFCVFVLRQDIEYLHYPKNFTIIDTADQKAIIKAAYKEIGIDSKTLSISSVLNYIAGNKVAEIDPHRAINMANNYDGSKLKAQVYNFYVNYQQQLLALDFDDLLLWVKKLFLTHKTVLEKWQNKYSVILVDEFQDIDHIQYIIIKCLVGNNNALYVVGDPDQTIYTWRGADVDIIMSLEKEFPGLETIVLTMNYRSTSTILEAANNVISNNKYRVKKELTAFNPTIDKINFFGAINEDSEGMWVASMIKTLVKSKKINYNDVAVLYRANYLSRAIERELFNAKIPYIIYGGIRFNDRKEVKDVLSYLRLLVTQDDLAFKRIINVPRRKAGEKTIDLIEQQAKLNNCNLYDTLANTDFLSGQVRVTLSDFYQTIEFLRQQVEKLDLLALVKLVIDSVGYSKMLSEESENDGLENVKELINDIDSFKSSFPEADLVEYLQFFALYSEKKTELNQPFVSLMTVHAGKGLEFDSVFVIGLNEGVFPSDRSLSEGIKGLEEERRLAYVAFTRAKNRLYLSDSKGFSYQTGKSKASSRFVQEIGEEHLLVNGNVEFNFYDECDEPTYDKKQVVENEDVKVTSEVNWQNNNKVLHDVFHEGIILKVDGDILEIAFSYPYGIRKISKNFKGMRKIT